MFGFFESKKVSLPKKREKKLNIPSSLGKELAKREIVDIGAVLGLLPDPDEVLSTTGEQFLVYRKLMVDSQVRANVNSRKSGTMALNWEIARDKAKSRQVKIIEGLYQDLDIDSINSAILNAPMFGFQPLEVMWGRVGSYILPVDIVAKNQEWFTFDSEGKARLLTVGNAIYGEELPDRKFLFPTYNDIHNKYYNPYGDRVLSSCFWPVTFKKNTFEFWTTFTEKYGMPYLIARTSSQSDADKEAIQSQLENMVADAVAVLSGTAEQNDISVIDTGKTANAQLYAEHIKAADEMISKAIVGQTLTADSGGGSGSYALGKVHAGVREDIVYSDKKIVERTHNQLIRWIYEINFAGADIPKFEMFETDDVDKTLAERDQILSNQGVKFTKSYYIENYGLNEKDFDISEAEPAIPDGQPDADAEEFAEGPDDLERILSQFTDAQLQGQINSILKPVLSFINQSEDYAEIKKHIDKLSPKMSSLEIEDTLAKILVLSETIGRFNVKKKA